MTDIALALSQFWQQFGVPAYFSDLVPDDAVLPYIVFDVSKGVFSRASIMNAYSWHKVGLGSNEDRMELADKIAAAIPEKGAKLPLRNGGFLVLYRNVDFQSMYNEPEDPSVIGIRTSVEVHFYTM